MRKNDFAINLGEMTRKGRKWAGEEKVTWSQRIKSHDHKLVNVASLELAGWQLNQPFDAPLMKRFRSQRGGSLDTPKERTANTLSRPRGGQGERPSRLPAARRQPTAVTVMRPAPRDVGSSGQRKQRWELLKATSFHDWAGTGGCGMPRR